MEITTEELNSYRRLYQQVFGKDLSPDEAYADAISLLVHVKRIYQPITQRDYDMLMSKRAEENHQQ